MSKSQKAQQEYEESIADFKRKFINTYNVTEERAQEYVDALRLICVEHINLVIAEKRAKAISPR
jgi:hypothetical protein